MTIEQFLRFLAALALLIFSFNAGGKCEGTGGRIVYGFLTLVMLVIVVLMVFLPGMFH